MQPIRLHSRVGCFHALGLGVAVALKQFEFPSHSTNTWLLGLCRIVPRRAMCMQGQLLAYAGVGVVQGSQVAAEWQELNLKVKYAHTAVVLLLCSFCVFGSWVALLLLYLIQTVFGCACRCFLSCGE